MSLTKRASIYAAIVWVCLLAFVVIVQATNLELAGVKPEKDALGDVPPATLQVVISSQ